LAPNAAKSTLIFGPRITTHSEKTTDDFSQGGPDLPVRTNLGLYFHFGTERFSACYSHYNPGMEYHPQDSASFRIYFCPHCGRSVGLYPSDTERKRICKGCGKEFVPDKPPEPPSVNPSATHC
jgi:hypothetical protein